MVDLENDEGNIETEQTFNNVVLESNKKRSRKRQRNMNEWKQVTSKRLKNSGLEYITNR